MPHNVGNPLLTNTGPRKDTLRTGYYVPARPGELAMDMSRILDVRCVSWARAQDWQHRRRRKGFVSNRAT
jgi:hypothetical protein